MDAEIQLRVLGSLELDGDGGRTFTEILAQPKRVALLTYLALTGPHGWQRRDTLQGIFWPERDREHAQSALRKGLYVLKQEMGDGVIMRRGDQEVRLAEGAVWCDAVVFEREAMGGDPEVCTELYRGNLLEGFFIREAPEFERWLDAERFRLAELHERVVRSLAEAAAEEGRWLDQIKWRRRLTRLDPYNSRYVFRLMEALLMAGEPANAIRVAEEHRRFVRQDLGTEPAAEVIELAERLRESVALRAPALDVEEAIEASNGRSPPLRVGRGLERKGYLDRSRREPGAAGHGGDRADEPSQAPAVPGGP